MPAPEQVWTTLERRAEAAGLNVRFVLPRSDVERNFARAPAEAVTPGSICPGYQCAVLLGSAGRPFWEQFGAWQAAGRQPERDPLDRFTEGAVAPLLNLVQQADPAARAAFPFRHAHQIVPFLAFFNGSGLLARVPFGVSIAPGFGPWFAWRAAILTALPLAPTPLPTESPCESCPAPCVQVCPAKAVDKAGFRWRDCADFRLGEATCRQTCLARRACPVGREWAYGAEQMAFHSGASLREMEKLRAREG